MKPAESTGVATGGSTAGTCPGVETYSVTQSSAKMDQNTSFIVKKSEKF